VATAATPTKKSALIIIDVQTCFTKGGSLAVPDGDEIIPTINAIRNEHDFDLVVRTQDWHCDDHVSFASQHDKADPFSILELDYTNDGLLCDDANGSYVAEYGSDATVCSSTDQVAHRVNQTLWPDHCIIGTEDAAFNPDLSVKGSDIVIQKGNKCYIDSYSGFYDNGGFDATELQSKLDAAGITDVYTSGLATDFCVYYTSKDSAQLGYKTFLIEDATRGISEDGVATAIESLKSLGVSVIQSADIDLTVGGGTKTTTIDEGDSYLSNWMGTNMFALANSTFLDLSLPGTHDTMTYDLSTTISDGGIDDYPELAAALNFLSPIIPDSIDEFAIAQATTQGLTVTQQLDAGIRFLDFRIMYTSGKYCGVI
jgi:nicotinamidase/pyrazinamidase